MIPKPDLEQLTMVESAVEIPLYKEDLEYTDSQRVQVVIIYNGRDHFVPSTIMSHVQYNQWKLSILMKFAEASLHVIDDVDSNFVSPEVAVHSTSIREQFLTTRTLFTEEASPAKTAVVATRVQKSHGPLFFTAILASGVPQSPVGSPFISSHVPSTPHRCTSRKGKTGPKQHICHICGIAKSRKSDLKDHLSDVHQIGSSRVCNISSHVPSTPHRCTSRKGKTGPKQHICHICGIAKSRKSDLKDHLSDVHQIGSSRVCNICKKQFK